MKVFTRVVATVALITCVFGLPIYQPSVKDFKIKKQFIHSRAEPCEHDITLPTNAILAAPTADKASPATVDRHTAAGRSTKFGRAIAVRFPKKYTTAAAAKSSDKLDCWVADRNIPEECVDDNEGKGKGKIYTTQKEQKKGEDLEQAKEDWKIWEGHLHWDGNDGK